MGWWQVGLRGSKMWGDAPADTFAFAIDEIRDEFEASLDRPPTKQELRDGLEFVLSTYDESGTERMTRKRRPKRKTQKKGS